MNGLDSSYIWALYQWEALTLPLSDLVSTLTFVTVIIGCVIAVCTFFFDRKNEAKTDEHVSTSLTTKLDFISEDIKDIKADQRVFQRDINDVRAIALDAKARADTANRRIDSFENDISARSKNHHQ